MSATMRRPRQAIATVFVVIVATSACNGDGETVETTARPSSTTTTSNVSPTTSTSTTSSPVPSTETTVATPTSPPTSPPGSNPVENEDFVAVVQDLLDLRLAIDGSPDPTRAQEVYVNGSQNWQYFENQLANKQRDGLRTVEQDRTLVLSALVGSVPPETSFAEFVEVVAVQQYPTNWGRIVDGDGNTVFDLVPDPIPAEPTVEVRYTLARPLEGGPWRIAFINGE
jgi:hypothetical protein